MRPCIAVVGGGISGLAAAHRLVEQGATVDVVLLDANSRLGGVLETTRRDGFLIEAAADNFLTSPSNAVHLVRRLGMEPELICPDSSRRQAFVVHRGRLEPIPAGFLVMAPSRFRPMLATRILSCRGKLRMGLETLIPRKSDDADESMQSFVHRRFGREVFDRLVQPLVGGIYTADPALLSVEATMPRFRQMERVHGSLIRAMLRQPRIQRTVQSGGARYGQFAAPRDGMSSLVQALAESLPPDAIRLDSPVEWLDPQEGGRWLISTGGKHRTAFDVDGVIVATPAHHSARLLADVHRPLAHELERIEYASCAIVSLGYRRNQIGHPLNGFGFVVPLIEGRTILSCSFSSEKYSGRAPDGSVLLRVFIGGACQSGLLRLPASQLVELAEREVADLLQIQGEPILRHVTQQQRAMPQYHVGHQERVTRIHKQLTRFPTLALAGSAYGGVGVPACIKSGEAAADHVLSSTSRAIRKSPQTVCK